MREGGRGSWSPAGAPADLRSRGDEAHWRARRRGTARVKCLEAHRAHVAEGRVTAARVVEAFDVGEHGGPGFDRMAIRVPLEQLALERGEEALGEGVVVAIADRAHGRLNPGLAGTESLGRGEPAVRLLAAIAMARVVGNRKGAERFLRWTDAYPGAIERESRLRSQRPESRHYALGAGVYL